MTSAGLAELKRFDFPLLLAAAPLKPHVMPCVGCIV